MSNILVFDIETTPGKAWIWSGFQKYVPHTMVESPPDILMWSAKWLGSDHIYWSTAWDYSKKKCLTALRDLLDEADIVIAHNGDKFDIRRLNTFFLKEGVEPPSPSDSIDTLKVARAQFGFMYNRLGNSQVATT